ncbi:phage tail protein [Escherichia coli]|uniref:phage tail protein n=2 Tax=Escherichia coli TaxID=562 RepID=UPI0017BB0CBF|nr:phage tail protein [Escherichia coli]EFL0316804.1 phage tail protein [Escherichia coli]EHV3934887.1 phage tail protein [Escherichia coli]EHX3918041.1 phage tail protein [Escherichia coli]EIK8206924.1 phage tail protein [Escherichia coli]EIP7648350.1 phage tail protein [Escherichia coli]
MSTKFYTLLTDIGAAKLASAAALGVPLKITHMAVGDGGGVLPTPDAKQTALVNEKRRAALNMLYIDPQNSSQIIAEQVIPENEGGWWIREVGLFDESGALIAVGNCPESYKPQLAEGSGRTQTVRMVLITSSTDNIILKIDPAVVLATRKYVDDKVLELKLYVDDQMRNHIAAQDPHTQYAQKHNPTFTGEPKAPTPAAGNNTTRIATTEFVQAAITALINGAPATLDTLKEIAAAINNDPKFSTTINNALALKAPLSSPALTGTPTAPTAAQSVNNTQIATTAFVKSAIAGMVGSAPAALDTLNELAAALGNDPNFATTMLNALAGKQPLDNTLTNLSGKDVAGLLTYLGLGEATFGAQNCAVFDNAGVSTWNVPDIVKKGRRVRVKVIGGGGSGGYPSISSTNAAGGGGGGGGGVSESVIDLTGIDTVTITVGSGGESQNTSTRNGNPGGTSSFGAYLSATGGDGGGQVSGGAGGKGVGGQINTSLGPGSPGASMIAGTDSAVGGSGGGPGGNGQVLDSAGNVGSNAKGPGGGGAGLATKKIGGVTGAGHSGIVIIYW